MPDRRQPMPLVDFYRAAAGDDRGRRIHQILQWDDDHLEAVHDYIQWLFPLAEPSRFNPDAPTLDAGQIAAFRSDAALREQMLRSLERMLRFYGLRLTGGPAGLEVVRGDNYEERRLTWVYPGSHNYLRLTRILKSLCLAGLADHAQALLTCLTRIVQAEGGRIPARTLSFWQDAVAEEE